MNIPQLTKSITFDRQSKDYRCEIIVGGESVSLGYTKTRDEGEQWCNDEAYRLLQDGVLARLA